jgi:hypothetical protein
MALTAMKEKTIKRTKDGMRVEYDLCNMTRGKNAKKSINIVGAAEQNEYQPRTELGRKLMAARRRIVASGEKLLSRAEVSREVKERRGGSIDE